jgi:predicted site-specific integrase-resolvase
VTAPGPTIRLTIEQAAARVGRSPETIRRWIRQGRLTVVDHPMLPHRWVDVDELLEVERVARQAKRATLRGGPSLRYGAQQQEAS